MSQDINENSSELSMNGYREDVIRAFVGKNADYYINKWKSAKEPAKRAGWNWAGFFVGLFWMGYRRMYKILFMILGLFILIDIIQLFVSFDLSRGVSIGISAVAGGSGNSLYYNHMNQKIKSLSPNSSSDDELKELAKTAGGATWKGVGITLLLFIAYIIVTSILGTIFEMLFLDSPQGFV